MALTGLVLPVRVEVIVGFDDPQREVYICHGAHLARRELRVLLEEWFSRIPEFRVRRGADTTVFPELLSIRNLPFVWDSP